MSAPLLPAKERSLQFKAAEDRLRGLARFNRPLHSLLRVLMTRAVVETFAITTVASKGSRTPGIDGLTGDKAKNRMAWFVEQVLATIASAGFMSFALVEVPKADGGTRPLAIPTLVERAAGASVAWMLNVLFDSLFLPGVIGCRPGLGPHDALLLAMKLASKAVWLLKIDLRDFFGSIDHMVALTRIALRVGDKKLLHLLEQMMKRAVVGAPAPRTRGIGQGCPASPVIANIVAQHVDEWIASQGLGFVRYLDDFVIFFNGGTLAEVERFVSELTTFLGTVSLEIAPKKTVIAPTEEGVPFLGHQLFKSSTGDGHVQPHPDRILRFQEWMHERADALSNATNLQEAQSIKNQLFNRTRGFADYYLPHRDSLRIAARVFLEAAVEYPRIGLDQPELLHAGSR